MKKLFGYRYKAPPPTLQVLYQGKCVAELEKYPQGYIFRYLPAFEALHLLPFPGLAPEKGDIPSEELPAFFQERLPDMRRPEVQEKLRLLKIPSDDTLRLLAAVGSHAITDPFELRLKSAA
jgi:HipA-like protein